MTVCFVRDIIMAAKKRDVSLKFLRAIAQTSCIISLESAIETGDVGRVWMAFESGETVDGNYFKFACERGHTDIVRLLLELPLDRGVDPAARGNEALRYTC